MCLCLFVDPYRFLSLCKSVVYSYLLKKLSPRVVGGGMSQAGKHLIRRVSIQHVCAPAPGFVEEEAKREARGGHGRGGNQHQSRSGAPQLHAHDLIAIQVWLQLSS